MKREPGQLPDASKLIDDINDARYRYFSSTGAERRGWERTLRLLGAMLRDQIAADRRAAGVSPAPSRVGQKRSTRAFPSQQKALSTVGERQIRVTISTRNEDRDGDVIEPDGLDFAAFLRTRSVLWQHDQTKPIAKAISIERRRDGLSALVQFPQPGISQLSDEVYGLVKEGVVNAASIGFIPIDFEFRDNSRAGGLNIMKAELIEFSLVTVPSNRESLIQARSRSHADT